MRSKAVVLESPRGTVLVTEVEIPEPGPGEVLLKMEASGICHSDLFVSSLEKLPLLPLTLGHEGVGRVMVTGEGVESSLLGSRVGITFLAGTCGGCEPCSRGFERYCTKQINTGFTAHGVHAEYAVARAQWLARIPDGLGSGEAAPLCCAGWTAYAGVRETGLHAGQTIGIFGLGGLGHLAVQYAHKRGRRVAAVDVSEEKLALARELGADVTVFAESAGKTLLKQVGGVDASVVFTGSPAAIQQAFRAVKRMGSVVLVGMSANQYELPLVDTVLKGVRIQGSYIGTRDDLAQVLALGALGTIKPRVERHSIDEAPLLLERMREGKLAGRAVITF
jgi:alcohol dehydrogenase, propanol-preferring